MRPWSSSPQARQMRASSSSLNTRSRPPFSAGATLPMVGLLSPGPCACPGEEAAERAPCACRRRVAALAHDDDHAGGDVLPADGVDGELVQRPEIARVGEVAPHLGEGLLRQLGLLDGQKFLHLRAHGEGILVAPVDTVACGSSPKRDLGRAASSRPSAPLRPRAPRPSQA